MRARTYQCARGLHACLFARGYTRLCTHVRVSGSKFNRVLVRACARVCVRTCVFTRVCASECAQVCALGCMRAPVFAGARVCVSVFLRVYV